MQQCSASFMELQSYGGEGRPKGMEILGDTYRLIIIFANDLISKENLK